MIDESENRSADLFFDSDNLSFYEEIQVFLTPKKVLPFDECERIAKEFNVTLDLVNATCLEHAPNFTYSLMVRTVVLTVLAFLSLVGNVMTIISIKRRRRHNWSSVYNLILHLSVADLFVTFFCLTGEAAWSYTVAWVAGNAMCKIFKFAQMFCLYLSTFVLVLIGVDRFVAVRYPMKCFTKKRCKRLVLFVWIFSLLLSIPQLVIFHIGKGPFYEEFYQCVTYGFYTEPWQEQVYTIFTLVFTFVLPLLILISTYVSTFITIARNEKVFRIEVASHGQYVPPDLNRRRLMRRAKMKSLRFSVVIVAAFIICWAPYYLMMIIFMFLNPDKHFTEELQSIIFFFGMSNSVINPLIYGAFHVWRPKRRRNSFRSNGLRDSTRRSTATNYSIRCSPSRGRVVMKPEETSLVVLDEDTLRQNKTNSKLLGNGISQDSKNGHLHYNGRSSTKRFPQLLLKYKAVLPTSQPRP